MKCTLNGTLSLAEQLQPRYIGNEVFPMDSKNATDFRKTLFSTLEQVIEFDETISITTKKGNAVVMSQKEYDSLMETISLLSKPGFLERVKEGEKADIASLEKFDPAKGL